MLDRAHIRQRQKPSTQMAFQHGTACEQADQAAVAVSQPDVMTYPGDIVDDIAKESSAFLDHLVHKPGEQFLEYRAPARQKPVGMAPLRDALARSVCCRELVAFEHSYGGKEIRQRASGQQPTDAGTDDDRMLTQTVHGNSSRLTGDYAPRCEW